jgi:putative ABC transport system substrate-binding protein
MLDRLMKGEGRKMSMHADQDSGRDEAGDILVEQAIKFDLIINRTPSKALGLTNAVGHRRRGVSMMRRRKFIAGLGSAVAWPMVARAQQGDRVRRIGVLTGADENDPWWKARISAFTQVLADLGWSDGRNVRMDLRWGRGDPNRMRALARELVGLQPEIILTDGTAVTAALQRETRTIPIVFAGVSDPVGSGIVPRLDRANGNITGFANYEATLGGKWIELLSEIAPGIKRAAIIFNPDTAPPSAFMPSLETAARSLKVAPIIAPVHSDREIETAIIALGREPRGGLVIAPDVFSNVHRVPIILAAARNSVPAVYTLSDFVNDGGLLSYGVDRVDTIRRAATYVDRILRGAKPGDLPVQFPTKFEMVVNLKTAKSLGLTMPQSILLRADEVIE